MEFENGDVVQVKVIPKTRTITVITAKDKDGIDISSRNQNLTGGIYLGMDVPFFVARTSSAGTNSTVITCTCELWRFPYGNGGYYILPRSCKFSYAMSIA